MSAGAAPWRVVFMLYFLVVMASTLWLQGRLGDERLTIGAVFLVMLVLPPLVRRMTGDR